MKIFLELDEKDGRFFEYSKDPKEGYEKHTSSTGKVSYRKTYAQGAIGKLKYINEVENDFGKGKFKSAQIVLENKNKDLIYTKVTILTNKGSLNEYFESLATFLPNLKFGETYRLFPYSMETTYTNKNGEVKPTTNRAFSISTYNEDSDEKLDKVERAHTYGEAGDIPNVVWNKEEDMGTVKNVKDDKERRNFLYKSFLTTLSPSSPATSTEKEKPKEQSKPTETAKEQPKTSFNEEEDDDDLPF